MTNSTNIYYYLYRTTNTINNNIYVGVHQTKKKNDPYMGSGILILKAIKKYGRENFKKEILEYFNNREDMLAEERRIVDEAFIARKDTYNIIVGGCGGGDIQKAHEAFKLKYGDEWKQVAYDNTHNALIEKHGDVWGKVLMDKNHQILREKYGDDYQKVLNKKAIEALKDEFGEDWGKKNMARAVDGLKAKYGDDCWKHINQKSREALKAKYGEDWGKEHIKKATEALKAKYGEDWGKEHIKKATEALKKKYKNGSKFCHNEKTGQIIKIPSDEPIPEGFAPGQHKKGSLIWIHNPKTGEKKHTSKTTKIPKGWKKGIGPNKK